MDITYIPMAKGFVYLAVVLDWFSRRVLSWRVSITMEAAFCVETLEEALAKHGKPEIFNTDQGSQFTCPAFTGVLAKHEITISMDGKGAWRDNVFVERLWRSVKYEEVYLHAYDSVARRATRSGAISISTIAAARIRALTARHPIKPTSGTRACRRSAWQPNPGRRSTYPSGNSVRTSGATSDSPQPCEDYRDVYEKRAPLHSSPPPSAPDWPDETRPLGRWIVVGSPSSPTQVPTAEALETQGGPADYGSQGRGRQPLISLPLYSAVRRGGGTWVGLRSRAKRPDGGGLLCWRARTFFVRAGQAGVQAAVRCVCTP